MTKARLAVPAVLVAMLLGGCIGVQDTFLMGQAIVVSSREDAPPGYPPLAEGVYSVFAVHQQQSDKRLAFLVLCKVPPEIKPGGGSYRSPRRGFSTDRTAFTSPWPALEISAWYDAQVIEISGQRYRLSSGRVFLVDHKPQPTIQQLSIAIELPDDAACAALNRFGDPLGRYEAEIKRIMWHTDPCIREFITRPWSEVR